MSTTALPTADPRETRRALGRLLRTRRGTIGGAVLVLLGASVAGLALPAALGFVVDAVVDGEPARLGWLVAVIAALGVLHGLLTGLGRLLVARLGEGVLADLRGLVLRRLLRLPSSVVEAAGRGELVSRASTDTRIVGDVLTGILPAFASAGFSIVVTLVGLGAIDWRFALAALAAVPVQACALRAYLKRAVPAYREARAADGERSQRILESVDAADTVRAMGASAAREAAIDEAARRSAELELRAARIGAGFWNGLNFAELLGLGAVLAVGFALVASGGATVGGATAAALYFHALFGPIGSVLAGIDDLQKAGASLARLVGVLELPERPRRAASRTAARASVRTAGQASVRAAVRSGRPARVEFDGVGFDYDGAVALDGVSFRAEPGETIALVGASGAGKSTVAALLLGAHTPATGRILLDGVDATDAPGGGTHVRAGAPDGTSDLRPLPSIGLAGQEPHVFAGALADDLRLAKPDATDAELRAALDAVGALGWAEALPDGLGTVIGSGGHALTLVESQQLALARLLLHDPAVLVLDEATAAAGGSGDHVLDRAAARVARGRTTIAIAHRLDQAARADRVVVLDRGRVVEVGRHDGLVAAGGAYARLWAAWSDGR